ncbi:MAG TPA: PAS domain-containing protein [Polyangia bacterium]|nr:PAS domain-containing protein [Polyangia bacterium]
MSEGNPDDPDDPSPDDPSPDDPSPGDPLPEDPALSSILPLALDAISDGIQIIGFDWRYLYVNRATCRQTKRSRDELAGKALADVHPGIYQTPLYRVLLSSMRGRTARRFDNEFAYPDGTRAIFALRIEPCPQGLFVLSVDVTEQRRLQFQLHQAQKTDAVGQFIGGVAHDFNNLLTAMRGFTLLALKSLEANHRAAPDLREVLSAIERANGLTRKLLAFTRHEQG